ncbi:MAG: hypothetical protein QGG54_05015, partial [Gammaproteobacteria bacterium]|nr:hypothetical protein [Gammaproteobacteria bacterium]
QNRAAITGSKQHKYCCTEIYPASDYQFQSCSTTVYYPWKESRCQNPEPRQCSEQSGEPQPWSYDFRTEESPGSPGTQKAEFSHYTKGTEFSTGIQKAEFGVAP